MVIWESENSEDFFAHIEKLTDEDKFTECIDLLTSIPQEERDYNAWYQLARAYQNFAIIGDDDKGTYSFIGEKALLKSIEILNLVKEEGENKAEWNMRMAYAYQYLTCEEERALPYAIRWGELAPDDANAFEVIKECNEEIEKRKQMTGAQNNVDASCEAPQIEEEWGIYLCNQFWCDFPAVIRLNLALPKFDLIGKYPKRLTLQILYKNPDEYGFPTREEGEFLYQIEDDILDIIEKHGDILTGVVKCDDRVHIIAYVKDEAGYAAEISELMEKKFSDYVYTVAILLDENWEMYFDALYPDKYEYQSIMNNALIENIRNNGDIMVPRVLEHFLLFKTEENRNGFLAKVIEDGFEEINLEADDGECEDEDTEYPYELLIGREDSFEDIDEIVWNLMDLAEEFDGAYDGWGCNVVRE